ncbi:DoxX family protein [Chitinophaga nivalis]|uniref:DoxX family protein n=1 Tax=Chitinophaga nivalis TaxID=2991709 RepID=A0ABT3IJZ8_9BACT|nr:DoxX family protein [Chitinophaga nivalis]MCW3466022.1 DoxX family protein [Chitinophaga nivalis]MCW3484287.1 DoxX family protein [Chitinophaga nivalis]
MYKEVMRELLSTGNSWVPLILRVTIGGVLFPHVVQKMFGWLNGPGLSGEMKFMTEVAGLPAYVAALAILVECGGTVLLLTGMGTRIAAIGIGGLFIGMIICIHGKNGFFMNWFGKLPAGQEGFEFHLLVLGMCLALLITGGGRYSLDRWLAS